jgi:hypothetical protein
MRLTGSSSTPISSAAQRSNPLRDFRIDRLIEETGQVLFGTAGTPGREPPQLAAMPALRLLDDAVRACQPNQAPGQTPLHATICLWAALHGLVTLRRARPSFPWPSLDELIDCLITTHVSHSVRGQTAAEGS